MTDTTGAHATSKPRLPYGTWPSPIDPRLLGQVGDVWSRFDRPEPTADATYWLESRPVDGRVVLVRRPLRGEAVDVTPPGFDVRTGVHEYGGGAYFLDGETVYFSNHADGRIYRQTGGGAPAAITPEPESAGALRYAEGVVVPDGGVALCVRETHRQSGVEHAIVAVPTDGSGEPRAVVTGHDFVAFPCVHSEGTYVAWTSWELPGMPFHGSDLWVAPLGPDGTVGRATHVAGGSDESIFQPQWSPAGDLHFVSDRTGWWNLYRVGPDGPEPVWPVAAELGWPQWLCSLSSYAFLADGRIACLVNECQRQRLVLLEPGKRPEEPDFPFTAVAVPQLRAHGSRVVFIAATDTTAPAVIGWDAETGEYETLAGGVELDPGLIATPRRITFRSRDGSVGRARFYPPANPDVGPPDDERAPLVVMAHGGPTDQTTHGLRLDVQLLTSRGIAVLDVDYGGSSGYGRAFADRLRGRWGLVDVHDCIDAALELAARGEVDRARMAILGGSAGGYLVLSALAYHDVFAAGVSFYGISDLTAFAYGTHPFESGYVKWLVGAPVGGPEYRLRSPVFAAAAVRQPLLLLHGSADHVVPPSQSAEMAAAVERAGGAVRHVVLPGEGHGFRRAAGIELAYDEVLEFLGVVFGTDASVDD